MHNMCVCVWCVCVCVYIGGVRGAGGDKARRCEFRGWRSPTSPPIFCKSMCLICPQIAWSSHVNAFVYMLICMYLYMYAFLCMVFICGINMKRMCLRCTQIARSLHMYTSICVYIHIYIILYYIHIHHICIYIYIICIHTYIHI